jgi:hypothetical protein
VHKCFSVHMCQVVCLFTGCGLWFALVRMLSLMCLPSWSSACTYACSSRQVPPAGVGLSGVSSGGPAATNSIVLRHINIYCTFYCILSRFNVIHELIQLHPAIAVPHPRGHWIAVRLDGHWTATGRHPEARWTAITGRSLDVLWMSLCHSEFCMNLL